MDASYVVMDAETGRLRSCRFGRKQFHNPSTTKIMTAMVALDCLRLDHLVSINPAAMRESSLMQTHWMAGDVLSVLDLLAMMIVGSDNGAALALAEEVSRAGYEFIPLMNDRAQELGCHSTIFSNPHGLPDSNHISTAFDLALMARKALDYPALMDCARRRVVALRSKRRGIRFSVKSTNPLLALDRKCIGLKTGWTQSSGYCFVGVFKCDEGPMVTAVMGEKTKVKCFFLTKQLIANVR